VTGKGSVRPRIIATSYGPPGVTVFFEDKETNPFIGGPALSGSIMDDFNGDKFRTIPGLRLHRRRAQSRRRPLPNGRPIGTRATSAGSPPVGQGLEAGPRAKWYRRWFDVSGTALQLRLFATIIFDLDPTYKRRASGGL